MNQDHSSVYNYSGMDVMISEFQNLVELEALGLYFNVHMKTFAQLKIESRVTFESLSCFDNNNND